MHGDRVRYVYEHSQWLAWDGRRWAPDALGMVERLARRVPVEMLRHAADVADDDARRKLVAWAMQSESAARIDAMLRLARSHEKIVLRAADLDADPWVLNVANGTVDLTTGELRAHLPADLQSKITTGAYDPGVPAPRWMAFLEEVLPDADVRRYFHKLAGYSVAGDVGENVLPFAYGSGANGKSVAFHVIGEVLGDYAT
jgi:putative DNA primase/helicase